MNIEIRKLSEEETPPMELLLLADPSEELVRSYLEKGLCHVAIKEKEVIGVILSMPTKKATVEIMNIAVKEEYQNKGIGRRLILHAVDEIKKSSATTIEIGTGNPGVVQMLLYQKCGFRIVDIDFDFFRRNYSERIFENGIECRDMIRMRMNV